MRLSTLLDGGVSGLLLAILSTSAVAQSTWWVDCNARDEGRGTLTHPYKTIQFALEQPTTGAGDTILVAPGTYPENLLLAPCSVTLRSTEGARVTVIDGQGLGSTVTIMQSERGLPTVIQGFTITGGSGSRHEFATAGGGVFIQDTQAELIGCVVTGNQALRGGGVAVIRAEVKLAGTLVHGNAARSKRDVFDGHGGGIFVQRGELSIVGGRIFDNLAGRGGGIYAQPGKLFLDTVEVSGNHAGIGDFLDEAGEGGGLYARFGLINLHNSTFAENLVEGLAGGGARLVNTTSTVVGCTFKDNAVGAWLLKMPMQAGDGGGLSVEGKVSVTASRFEGNYAPNAGGGFHGYGTVSDSEFYGNKARFGGGAWTGTEFPSEDCGLGGLVLDGCLFEGNKAVGSLVGGGGGAVFGPAYVTNSTLTGNRAYGKGGGAYGTTLVDCLLEGNVVLQPQVFIQAQGGGAFESHLVGCEVRENRALGMGGALGWGGGMYACNAERVVVHDNLADFGAGLVLAKGQSVTHLTVWGNQATVDGGGVLFLGRALVLNSIVWRNAPQGISAGIPDGSVTYSDVQGGWPGTGNFEWYPAMWAPESGDFHLMPSSYCIDAGDPLSPPDPDGSLPDMGALPFDPDWCGSPVVYCQAKVNSAGCLPAIGWTGSPTVSGPDDFVVTATNVLEQRIGILAWGLQPASSTRLGGTLCIEPQAQSFPAMMSVSSGLRGACEGSYAFPLTQDFMSSNGLSAGNTLYAQIWSRDPDIESVAYLGMTDALRITLCD